MNKFSLYETSTRYYVVGSDWTDCQFRVLKIDRTVDAGELSIAEDGIVYTNEQMTQLLNAIDDGNKGNGGLKLKYSAWGLLGFIRFTGPYYMLIVTKRSQVAMIGGHYIYQIDGTELVPLTTPSTSKMKSDRNPEEARFLGILNNLDLSRSCYYSYSYDITRTLQHYMTREKQEVGEDSTQSRGKDLNPMFVWNHYLLETAMESIENTFDWCLPIIYGYVDQATLSVYGRPIYITIIARRSRYFAGARFLKRGANDLGYVANDVETEQIVSEMLTTSFHAPGPGLFSNPNYTSYVQHRGSIPLYWTQDNTGVTPKPPIELNLVDPFYGAAALHFDNLFERYGAPIYVLNLVKARERTPRESKLLKEYTNAIKYLNQFLPEGKKMVYKSWDMSRASKSRDQDVIGTLESIAKEVVACTGFFRNGDGHTVKSEFQNGVARTNCIDCLDRTNAAQFVIGKCALGHQLHALGVIADTSLEYDTDTVNLFTHMYHDHGDTIAIQYGGSHLVNTMETYRKINQWTSHSRDMVESFKRYYNNSFLDSQRQEAYNLFLGNYIFAQGQPMLWDLATDYYLHHADPRAWSEKRRRSYIKWFTPEFLEERMSPKTTENNTITKTETSGLSDEYWYEYYRPLALSSFMKIFSYRMNSTLRYLPLKSTQEGRYDPSPFHVRVDGDHDISEKKRQKKAVTIAEQDEYNSDDTSSLKSHMTNASKRTPIQRWLQPHLNEKPQLTELANVNVPALEPSPVTVPPRDLTQLDLFIPSDKALTAQWNLEQFVGNSLHPSVTAVEESEYQKYISHPLNLPLVVSSNEPLPPHVDDYVRYVNGVTSPVVRLADPNDASEEGEDAEAAMSGYEEFLTVPANPLMVSDADGASKRYKAYRRWLKGKSLFNHNQGQGVQYQRAEG
ncbi:MAG: phosphatidylinositol-3,5-bisphosphate 5-phosphatase [Sclerophora amabilis]|nr:MAG: phosphatidylinositol-3,5-bisphosphate 5-phosphatase [Sclerophora amabilis]